jgi:hypothetical protein
MKGGKEMAVFTVVLNVAGKGKVEVGSVALDNPDANQFESVELIEQDAESPEDAILVVFLPS